MKLYVVVEGDRTEPALCRAWLPLLFPNIREVQRLDDLVDDTYLLVRGGGFPSYFDRLQGAAEDLDLLPDSSAHLLVWVDAEEVSAEARTEELRGALPSATLLRTTLLVASPCVETWLLGNRRFIKRRPTTDALRKYLDHFDVIELDPERCPKHPEDPNRAKTHLKYLKAACHERNTSYSKTFPGPMRDASYFRELITRVVEGHLASLKPLLDLPGRLAKPALLPPGG